MAAQHTRSFGREAVAVYLAAALVVFGTWAASRYLILRKFENIEQNDVARSIEVMRKALVTKNTEIETVSRDFARWDDMYSYTSTLDPNFEYQNFSEAGLDEMNVDLVWLLDPKDKLLSSFENDTDDARYRHPASDPDHRRDQAAHAASCASVLDQEGTLRLVQINGVPYVIAAHTVLHSDRSGPAAGTLVFARRIGRAGNRQHRRRHAAQRALRHARRSRRWPPKKPELLAAPDGRRIVRRSDNIIEGQLRLDTHRRPSAGGAVHHPAALGHAERPAGRALPGRPGRAAGEHRGRGLARLQRPTQAHRRRRGASAKRATAPFSIAPPPASSCSIPPRAA